MEETHIRIEKDFIVIFIKEYNGRSYDIWRKSLKEDGGEIWREQLSKKAWWNEKLNCEFLRIMEDNK